MLNRAIEHLLGRPSGPLHFRLLIQPIVATVIAVRAGLKDVRGNQPAFFWAVLTNRAERRRLFHSGWKLYGLIAVSIVIGLASDFAGFNAVKMVFWSAILNGILAPLLVIMVVLLTGDRKSWEIGSIPWE
jgi:Mn2+/Fe2+ NRAMP family transporter